MLYLATNTEQVQKFQIILSTLKRRQTAHFLCIHERIASTLLNWPLVKIRSINQNALELQTTQKEIQESEQAHAIDSVT